jgi:hypothetical protein
MAGADTFVAELEEKSRGSVERLVAAYAETLTREAFAPLDLLRCEQRAVIEAIEVAALWLCDSEEVSSKLALAERAGLGARRFAAIGQRLESLGLVPGTFDPRFGGYSKLFAFFRSLQSREERASAGGLTLGRLNVMRWELQGKTCEERGDLESAGLLRQTLGEDERRFVEDSRRELLQVATTEESQARARRAAFRTVEILGELWEPSLLRKFLSRSLKK